MLGIPDKLGEQSSGREREIKAYYTVNTEMKTHITIGTSRVLGTRAVTEIAKDSKSQESI